MPLIVNKLRADRGAKQPTRARKSSTSWSDQPAPLPSEILAVIDRVHNSTDRRILRTPTASRKMGIAPSTLWRDVKTGTCVPPIPIGERAVGWLEAEMDAILEVRAIAARSGITIDIRRFVALLIARHTVSRREVAALETRGKS